MQKLTDGIRVLMSCG